MYTSIYLFAYTYTYEYRYIQINIYTHVIQIQQYRSPKATWLWNIKASFLHSAGLPAEAVPHSAFEVPRSQVPGDICAEVLFLDTSECWNIRPQCL